MQQQGDAGHLHNGSNPNPGPGGGGVGSPCSARILARTRGELTSFGTSLLRPEAAAHKGEKILKGSLDQSITFSENLNYGWESLLEV